MEVIRNIWESIYSAVYSLLQALINLLPDSPFDTLAQIPEVTTIIKWINWIIPIQFFLSSMAAWLSSISIYYLYSLIMRWIKAID